MAVTKTKTTKTTTTNKTATTTTTAKATSNEIVTPTVETAETNVAVNTADMSENTTNTEVESEKVSTSVFTRKGEKYIPMDATVMVRNATGGKLIYVSKRLNGYEETWYTFGEEIPMQMSELYSMKNTDRSFFTENWIEVDPLVLKDLSMEKYYEKAVPIDEINNIFDETPEKITETINNMKSSMKTAFALIAIQKVEAGELTNINVINAIEKALNCSIYEH